LVTPVKAVGGPQLRVGDLPKPFRKRFLSPGLTLRTPLFRSHTAFFVEIRRHRLSGSLSIPTRPEKGVTRAISMKFHAFGLDLPDNVRTVKVTPSQ
jgi:hypothetical protein